MSTCLECPAEWLEIEMFRTMGFHNRRFRIAQNDAGPGWGFRGGSLKYTQQPLLRKFCFRTA